MNILLFTGYLDDKLNANNKIACEIAKSIALIGHKVTICGLSYTENKSFIDDTGIKWIYYCGEDYISKSKYRLEKYIESSTEERDISIKKFTITHPFSSLAIHHSYTPRYSFKPVINQAGKMIEYLHHLNDYDAVLAFQMPFWAEEALIKANVVKCKKCIYQLDPWGLHEFSNIGFKNPEQRKIEELHNFEKADFIFTTPQLYRQYKNHVQYKRFINKIIQVDFPNLKPVKTQAESPIEYNQNCVNILYAGIVNDDFRNPEIFLKTVTKLIKKGLNINVHFLGNNSSEILNKYISQYPNNIFSYNSVTVEKAFAAQKECDFLLNISNNISNMVPSKIFDYFSLGKPIINIQKIENCPTKEYMDKYPLSFNIEEFTEKDYSDRMYDFIVHNKGKRIEFYQVQAIYKTATPEYVANKIIETINNL